MVASYTTPVGAEQLEALLYSVNLMLVGETPCLLLTGGLSIKMERNNFIASNEEY